MPSLNEELAQYLLDNKDLRVWQNIRNWSGVQAIWAFGCKEADCDGECGEGWDTFYSHTKDGK